MVCSRKGVFVLSNSIFGQITQGGGRRLKYTKLFSLGLIVALFATMTVHAEISMAEFEAMKKEMSDMRMQMNGMHGQEMPVMSSVDTMLTGQTAPNQAVTTGIGKLKIGGLLQVWYYAAERDTQGLFSNSTAGVVDHNIAVSGNSFQVRRAEVNFTMDIHENVTAYIMTDFAREADAFRGQFMQLAGSNQGFVKAGIDNKIGAPVGSAPAILQDAVINFHGIVPHHDLSVGQMLPYFSQEDFNPNGWLDFVERSWIGNFYPRDTGAVLHGAWWCDGGGGPYEGAGNSGRIQYWLSAFNSPGYYQDGATQDHADDNASKDFLGRLMVRPLWSDCWGHLELSGAAGFGKHGSTPLNQAVTDINGVGDANGNPFLNGAHKTTGQRYSGYAEYRPGDFLSGLWLKGEYAWVKDSTANVPGTTGLFDPAGNGPPDHYEPFVTTGFYVSAGYDLGASKMHCIPCWAKGFEFDVRYQRYTNVWTQNEATPYKVSTYATKQGTAGINYAIRGHHDCKIQANYDIVEDPRGPADFQFHQVHNNVFSMNFQVMW